MDEIRTGRSVAEEEADTSTRVEPPETAALAGVLERHRDLVLSLALRNAHRTSDPGALVEAGIEGLLDACARFDESCGEFRAFAAWWIRQRIDRRLAA